MNLHQFPPGGSSRSVSNMLVFYRQHGESEHVTAVAQALDGTWQTTRDIAARSGRSVSYCRQVLEYLAIEGRAIARRRGRNRRFAEYLWMQGGDFVPPVTSVAHVWPMSGPRRVLCPGGRDVGHVAPSVLRRGAHVLAHVDRGPRPADVPWPTFGPRRA